MFVAISIGSGIGIDMEELTLHLSTFAEFQLHSHLLEVIYVQLLVVLFVLLHETFGGTPNCTPGPLP